MQALEFLCVIAKALCKYALRLYYAKFDWRRWPGAEERHETALREPLNKFGICRLSSYKLLICNELNIRRTTYSDLP